MDLEPRLTWLEALLVGQHRLRPSSAFEAVASAAHSSQTLGVAPSSLCVQARNKLSGHVVALATPGSLVIRLPRCIPKIRITNNARARAQRLHPVVCFWLTAAFCNLRGLVP